MEKMKNGKGINRKWQKQKNEIIKNRKLKRENGKRKMINDK